VSSSLISTGLRVWILFSKSDVHEIREKEFVDALAKTEGKSFEAFEKEFFEKGSPNLAHQRCVAGCLLASAITGTNNEVSRAAREPHAVLAMEIEAPDRTSVCQKARRREIMTATPNTTALKAAHI
jgi:hypothetical protein